MVCARVCVCFLSLSLFLSILVDLIYATSSTPDHVCLAEPTRGGWLVPPSLCLPILPVWSSPVWSNACRQPCAIRFWFSSLFLSFLFLSHDRHGWTIPLPLFFISISAPLPLPAPPPPPHFSRRLTFGGPCHSPGVPRAVPMSVNFNFCLRHRRVGERGTR